MIESNIELKDCPFCGGKAIQFQGGSETCGHGGSSDRVHTECENCRCGFSEGDYTNYRTEERMKNTAEKWNKRI